MAKYIFVKFTNNNDVSQFEIIFTKLRDYRTKVSILKNQYSNYLAGIGKYKDIYDIIQEDFSACCVYRDNFNTIEDVRDKLEELYTFYSSKI